MSIDPRILGSAGDLQGVAVRMSDVERRLRRLESTDTSLPPSSIVGGQVANNAITTNHISANSINASHIQAGAINAVHIEAGSINTVHLAAYAVTAAKIAANTITAAQIAANTITANEIAANAITTVAINAGAVTAAKIAADTITANEIAANAITTSELAANAVTAAKIAANTITAAQIAANTITATQIAAGTITGTEIAASTITSNKLNVSTLAAITTNMGAITAGSITGGTIQTASSGARTVMDSAGLRGYALDGVTKVFEINSGSGIASFTGTATLQAGSVVPGSYITGTVPATSVPAIGGGNQLIDSSFEASNVSGYWSAWDGSTVAPTIDTTQGKYGTKSATRVATGGNLVYFWRSGSGIRAEPGDKVAVSGWFKGPAGTSFVVGFRTYNNVGTNLGDTVGSAVAMDGTWKRVTAQLTVPATGYTIAFISRTAANATAGQQFWADALQLEFGEVVTAYAPMVNEILPGAVGTTELAANAVTAAKITDGTITTAKIGADQITSALIAAGAVDNSELAANAVTAAKITDGTITTAKIGASQITNALMAANSVDVNQIVANAVTAAKIAAGAVGTTQIANDAVTVTQIADNAVTTPKLIANAVTAAKIAANTITANEIAASTITTNEIAANTIQAADIAANTITAAQIAANTITASQIASATITASQLAANSVTATQIAAGAVTTNKLSVLVGGGNMLQDSSFETGNTSAVQTWKGSVASETTAANVHNGGKSMKFTVGADATGDPGVWHAFALDAVVAPGDQVIGSAWVKATAGETLYAAIRQVDSGNVYVTTTGSTNVTATGGWQRIVTAPVTIAAGVAGAAVMVGIRSTTAATGDILYVDDVQLEVGDVATAYSPMPDEILPGTIVASMIASNTITASQIAANTITAGQIAANTITASQIAANTITASQIASATITSTQLASNSVTATQIAAGAVTANKLNITTGGGNVIPDSSFESTAASVWAVAGGSVSQAKATSAAWHGANSLSVSYVTGTDPYVGYSLSGAALAPFKGQTVTFSAWVYRGSGTTTQVSGSSDRSILIYDGTSAASATALALATSAWTRVKCSLNVSASATSLNLRLYNIFTTGNMYFDGVQLEIGDVPTSWAPMTQELLPGTIVASMIAADTITGSQIAADAISTSELAANAVTAAKIAANTITASQIAANTITASQIASATITATQIATGAITTNLLAAGAVTAGKLTVTVGGNNMMPNSSFESSAGHGWKTQNGTLSVQTDTSSKHGTKCLRNTYTSATIVKTYGNGNRHYLRGGVKYTISMWVRGSSGTSYPLTAIAFLWSAATGGTETDLTGTVVNVTGATGTTSWQRLRAEYTPGSDTWFAPGVRNGATTVGGYLEIDAVQVEEGDVMTSYNPMPDEILPGTIGPTQITPNSITTNEILAGTILASDIATGTITANEIASATITGGKIAAGTITATNIAAGTITTTQLNATAIDGMTITGATIRTSASDPKLDLTTAAGLRISNVEKNMLQSPDFARVGAGSAWTVDNGLWARVDEAYFTSHSDPDILPVPGADWNALRVYGSTISHEISQVISAAASIAYTTSVWLFPSYSSTAPTLRVVFEWRDSSGATLSTSTNTVTMPAAGVWTQISTVSPAAPAGTDQVRISFRVVWSGGGGTGTGNTAYYTIFDAARAYIAGSTYYPVKLDTTSGLRMDASRLDYFSPESERVSITWTDESDPSTAIASVRAESGGRNSYSFQSHFAYLDADAYVPSTYSPLSGNHGASSRVRAMNPKDPLAGMAALSADFTGTSALSVVAETRAYVANNDGQSSSAVILGITDDLTSGDRYSDFQFAPTTGSTLPFSPKHGDEHYYFGPNGVVWRFRYNSGSASAYKWELVGGPPIDAFVSTDDLYTATANTWANLAAAGPSVTVPFSGDYIVSASAEAYYQTSGPHAAAIGVALGSGATPTYAHGIYVYSPSYSNSGGGTARHNGVTAGTSLTLRYYASNTNFVRFIRRGMTVIPVRVG